MNRGHRRPGERTRLNPCPACGLDSGERMQDTKAPFDYAILCTSCGCRTRAYQGLHAATKAWNRGDVEGIEKGVRHV